MREPRLQATLEEIDSYINVLRGESGQECEWTRRLAELKIERLERERNWLVDHAVPAAAGDAAFAH